MQSRSLITVDWSL